MRRFLACVAVAVSLTGCAAQPDPEHVTEREHRVKACRLLSNAMDTLAYGDEGDARSKYRDGLQAARDYEEAHPESNLPPMMVEYAEFMSEVDMRGMSADERAEMDRLTNRMFLICGAKE